MRDFTKGPVTGHLVSMGLFMAFTMLVQTAYFLVDLYFVSRLGKEAIAGVSAAGSVMLLAMSLSQAIAVGVMALASRAIGARKAEDADLVFNQGMGMALFAGVATLIVGYAFGLSLVERLGADSGAGAAARAYFAAFLPSLALMFPSAVLGSSLRAAGIVRAPTFVQAGSLLLNIVLAPVLIAGWGTGKPLGVAGAGLASTFAVVVAVIAMAALFPRVQKTMRFSPGRAAPRPGEWARLARIGAPSAAEFMVMFVITSVIYVVIRHYGAEAQAGFGIGNRVLQSIMLPAMAVAFSAGPIVGQNLGAGLARRVRDTFARALLISAGVMLALAALIHVSPSSLTRPFSPEPAVLAIANTYLQYISWNFVATAIVFTCSGVFQGLGDTTPSLVSSASRLFTFAAPALWLSGRPGVELEHIWMLSVASQILQAMFSLWLMSRALAAKLAPLETKASA